MNEQKHKPGTKRRWVRHIGLTLLSLIALLAIFHRPIIFQRVKFFAKRLAKEQKLDLEFEVSGSLFTTLTIANLRAKPTGPGPVERLEIGTLKLRYSLIGLLRKGLPGLLKEVELHDVFATIDLARMVKPGQRTNPQPRGKFPAMFPDRVVLDNINCISRSPAGDAEIAGLGFQFAPEKVGALKIETLNLPGVRRWSGITAGVTFVGRNLVLSDLTLSPEILFGRVALDVSKLDSDEIATAIEGVCFGAPILLTAKVTDLNGTNRLQIRAESTGLPFDSVADYFNLKLPLHGALKQFAVTFEGVPDNPASWSGNIATKLDGIAFEKQQLGAASGTIEFAKGHAVVAMSNALDPGNSIALKADVVLLKSLDGFLKTSASGRLDLNARDLAALSKPLARQALGDLAAHVDFKLTNGQLAADITIDSEHLATGDVEATKLKLAIHVEKNISAQRQPAFADLVTNTRGSIAGLRYASFNTDAASLAISNRGTAVTLEALTLAKGTNSVALRGSSDAAA